MIFAYRLRLVGSNFLGLQYAAVHLGNHGVGSCNITLNLRNDGVGFPKVVTNL